MPKSTLDGLIPVTRADRASATSRFSRFALSSVNRCAVDAGRGRYVVEGNPLSDELWPRSRRDPRDPVFFGEHRLDGRGAAPDRERFSDPGLDVGNSETWRDASLSAARRST